MTFHRTDIDVLLNIEYYTLNTLSVYKTYIRAVPLPAEQEGISCRKTESPHLCLREGDHTANLLFYLSKDKE